MEQTTHSNPTSTPTSTPTSDDIKDNILTATKSKKKWLAIVPVLLLAVGVLIWTSGKAETPSYSTEAVTIGDITTNASATGTLSPTRVVSVGSEISGKIESVTVEENDIVTKGQVLAVFDKTTLQSQLATARARLASSNASLRGVTATYNEAVYERKRTEKLVERGVIARAELDAARTTEIRSKADRDRARADTEQQKAAFIESEAQLEKAAILSPIDGVILTRSVEPGQTVASSLQAPELFIVAQDLTKMTLEIWIDEADVGLVKTDLDVTFTVSAWPEKVFEAVVKKINLSPTTTGNVVTYSATLAVDNNDGLLRPGMTAAATIVTDVRKDVLRVSSAALRFKPTKKKEEPLLNFGPGRKKRTKKGGEKTTGDRANVYVLNGDQLKRIVVTRGQTDGRLVEIVKSDLKEGDVIITQEKAVSE